MHARIARAAAMLIAACAGFGLTHAAPIHGPLEGKPLALANEVRSGIESIAGGLLGGELKGQVTGAVVEEDAPRRLTVRVAYEGFQGAKIWGELLNVDRRRQVGIVSGEPVTLSTPSAEVVLTFEAEAAGTPTVSSVLRISVAAPNRRSAGYVRSFRLGKEWSASEISGADFSVTITPRAIGSTTALGSTPSPVVPQASARVVTPPGSSAAPPSSAPPPASSPRTPPGTAARSMLMTPPMTTLSNKAGAKTLPPSRKFDAIHGSFFGLNPADANLGALGPDAKPLRPFADVRAEDIQLDLTKVLNVFPEVYQDRRPESGIYYVLPYSYALNWNETDGYAFHTVYSGAAQGAAGQVLMAARLDAGISPRDLAIATRIVEAYAGRNGLPKLKELRPLPIDTLSVSISDDLGRYSIPADRVTAHGLSDVTGQLEVSWVTDERTKNFIQEALVENVGINGTVTYAPTGRVLGPRIVPLRMLLADYSTFGPFRWDRTGWKNTTPYPVTLRYLHALRMVPGGPPAVYSWSLENTRVPPGGQVRWSSAGVPFWLDGQAEKMWIDYTVDPSCRACGTGAIAAVTGGVSTAGASQITFHSLTPLAETGAHDVQVEVRSRWFDPKGEALQTREFTVDGDEKDFLIGPLFLDERARDSDGSPMFEYRLSLTTKRGEVFTGNAAWIAGNALRVPIGRSQLERSIGTLPDR